ncbi:PAS domain-containing protein [Algoriphagus halophytocola]|uniref:histidine kinase n=1 Tax=Algoriphagus halophytocola TaxID=2991499 RepID=A0ABY6MNN3_9BACT|nr:PAS domain-containing protein [Algoriphagus sp. TR-M5]UZD24301.1 PAS domain-containing protein [Algoriphagus sp. TR-M5]
MNDWKEIQALSHLAVVSEYFLQVTLDKTGRVITSDSGIGPVPTFFDNKEKPIFFADCFLASNWAKYETQRLKAWRNSHQSFTLELQKIVHPEGGIVNTKWEFFFISEDFGTCLGIGHPLVENKPYDIGLGDFFDSASGDKELLDHILEDKLLGFWEFDLEKKTDFISQGLGHMLGYTQEELKTSASISWQDHIISEDYNALIHDLTTHFQTTGNIPFKREFRMRPKTNQVIWVLGFGKTIEWSDSGLPRKVVGCLVDISERKKQEIWLKEHHYFLKELAHEQSHSLRARVANILGILEIMEAEPQSDETNRLMQLIKNESKLLDQALKKSIKQSVKKNKDLPDFSPDEDQHSLS